jgi:hypothetical protein
MVSSSVESIFKNRKLEKNVQLITENIVNEDYEVLTKGDLEKLTQKWQYRSHEATRIF